MGIRTAKMEPMKRMLVVSFQLSHHHLTFFSFLPFFYFFFLFPFIVLSSNRESLSCLSPHLLSYVCLSSFLSSFSSMRNPHLKWVWIISFSFISNSFSSFFWSPSIRKEETCFLLYIWWRNLLLVFTLSIFLFSSSTNFTLSHHHQFFSVFVSSIFPQEIFFLSFLLLSLSFSPFFFFLSFLLLSHNNNNNNNDVLDG